MRNNIHWGYFCQFLQYGSGLIILPILLKKLNVNELAIWYIYVSISILINILDAGLSPTIARSLSFGMAGSERLLKFGYTSNNDKKINYELIKKILVCTTNIYIMISAISLIFLTVFGTIYIARVIEPGNNNIYISWSLFIIGVSLNIYSRKYITILQGLGLFAQYYKTNSLANLINLIVSSILVIENYGLIAMGCGLISSSIAMSCVGRIYEKNSEFYNRVESIKVENATSEVINTIWSNAWRLIITSLGSFLILRLNIFLCSIYLGLEITSKYAVTLQIYSAIQNIASLIFIVNIPKIINHRVKNNISSIKKLIVRCLKNSIFIYICIAIIFIFLGNFFNKLIGSNKSFLPLNAQIIILLMIFLELIHSLAASIILTKNEVPFMRSAIYSGILIATISIIGLKYFNFNIVDILIVQLIIQLAYNNWKWPTVVYKEFYEKKL